MATMLPKIDENVTSADVNALRRQRVLREGGIPQFDATTTDADVNALRATRAQRQGISVPMLDTTPQPVGVKQGLSGLGEGMAMTARPIARAIGNAWDPTVEREKKVLLPSGGVASAPMVTPTTIAPSGVAPSAPAASAPSLPGALTKDITNSDGVPVRDTLDSSGRVRRTDINTDELRVASNALQAAQDRQRAGVMPVQPQSDFEKALSAHSQAYIERMAQLAQMSDAEVNGGGVHNPVAIAERDKARDLIERIALQRAGLDPEKWASSERMAAGKNKADVDVAGIAGASAVEAGRERADASIERAKQQRMDAWTKLYETSSMAGDKEGMEIARKNISRLTNEGGGGGLGIEDIPVLTPEQVKQAPRGTKFKTTDGRIMTKV